MTDKAITDGGTQDRNKTDLWGKVLAKSLFNASLNHEKVRRIHTTLRRAGIGFRHLSSSSLDRVRTSDSNVP